MRQYTRLRSGRRPSAYLAVLVTALRAASACDCSWTRGGELCGTGDGSTCWTVCCGATEPEAKYQNIYPTHDDPFGAINASGVVDDEGAAFAFLIADHGLSDLADHAGDASCATAKWVGTPAPHKEWSRCPHENNTKVTGGPHTSGPCCQTMVSDLMRAKRRELEAQGKRLLFVGAAGDNFYFDGMRSESEGGAAQWQRWLDVYEGLTDRPWIAALGNHDLGDGDTYATCPERRPLQTVQGQAYASNQLDVDKGGFRPRGTEQYRAPDVRR